MIQQSIPHLGMRTLKTGVAVMMAYLCSVGVCWLVPALEPYVLDQAGPFYACIATVLCMQNSVGKTVTQGKSRLIGTAIGGSVGLLALTLNQWLEYHMVLAVVLLLGVMASIWLCLLAKQPLACAISGVVFCVIVMNHAGAERYIYALVRIAETALGVLIAVAVNYALPHHHNEETQKTA